MTKKIAFLASLILTCFCFSGCSNLFENLINEDLSFKKGDDSLLPVTEATGENAITSSGIVVIKNSEKNKTQILYNPNQKIYFVGKVPAGYSDFKVDYQNGTNISLLGKDDPVELKCYPNDSNAKVVWNLIQTWKYTPQEEVRTTKDSDGNEVTYRGIKAQKAEKLGYTNIPFLYGVFLFNEGEDYYDDALDYFIDAVNNQIPMAYLMMAKMTVRGYCRTDDVEKETTDWLHEGAMLGDDSCIRTLQRTFPEIYGRI